METIKKNERISHEQSKERKRNSLMEPNGETSLAKRRKRNASLDVKISNRQSEEPQNEVHISNSERTKESNPIIEDKDVQPKIPDEIRTVLTPTLLPVKHHSPKKRLDLPSLSSPSKTTKEKFIYGNYSKYYGYRNKVRAKEGNVDIRLDVFELRKELFCYKEMLDIGCNSGFITFEVAKRFNVKNIVGIDIDGKLINQAKKTRKFLMRNAVPPTDADIPKGQHKTFPFNVSFLNCNYVLSDNVLLECEWEQFDVILCLSVTKWIHLNFGDAGLKQAFRRMFLQLRNNGKLILEAQAYSTYGKRKNLSENILANYKSINFQPNQFADYLLSDEVGFKSVELMGVPEHVAEGFKRPIQVFSKG